MIHDLYAKQIGNAVPGRTAKALVGALMAGVRA